MITNMNEIIEEVLENVGKNLNIYYNYNEGYGFVSDQEEEADSEFLGNIDEFFSITEWDHYDESLSEEENLEMYLDDEFFYGI